MFRSTQNPLEAHVVPGALLALDIDGVLIDANRSFHEAVARALSDLIPEVSWSDDHFHAFKRLGGFNNDFRLAAAALALAETGVGGPDWLPDRATLESLETRIQALEPRAQAQVQRHYAETKALERPTVSLAQLRELPATLAILTGRPPEELDLAFEVMGFELPAVCDSAPRFRKPEPAGLLLLASHFEATHVVFAGDTRDDAECLRAARHECPDVRWTFAGVGPDRDVFLETGDLSFPDLPSLLQVLKPASWWTDER